MTLTGPIVKGHVKGLHTKIDLYLSDVSRRWIRITKDAERVMVLSPYLTQAAGIFRVSGNRCSIYTVFKAENFVSGASSIKTLLELKEHGCTLYHLPDLHAKILLVPGRFATVGSQNVTNRGKRNKEGTSVFSGEAAVDAVESLVERWLDEAVPITLEMLNEMSVAVQPLREDSQKLQRACQKLDSEIWGEESRRAAERDWIAKESQEEAGRLRVEQELQRLLALKIVAVKAKLDALLDGNARDRTYARELVAESAWWLTHPRGRVRAPRHQWNVLGSNGDWEITFGANGLNLSYILRQGKEVVVHWLDLKQSGVDATLDNLVSRLTDVVTGAVFHVYRCSYYNDYPTDESYMKFGGTGICVHTMVTTFLRQAGVLEHFPELFARPQRIGKRSSLTSNREDALS